jgi:2-dehydro-3-deoxygluconokinase
MKGGVITFGEVMMRLSCVDQARFTQANRFEVLYAGSEANVAASLSLWGLPSEHVTSFPDNDLGRAATASLQKYGVAVDHISFREGRMGVYFLEHGTSLRSSKIIYDRFDSVFANLDPGDFDWEEILQDARWFHWSGITPAISADAAEACLQAIRTARKNGVTVSGDINYRRNLWQYGKEAREVMPSLIEHSDIVVAGITDFENCVGITGKTFEDTCNKVVKAYPNIRTVISTVRDTVSASHNRLSGILWDGTGVVETTQHDIHPIVDRVGAGDAFMAGFIYATLRGMEGRQAIDFATAACALKHTVEGDVNSVSVAEVDALVSGRNIGKLLR